MLLVDETRESFFLPLIFFYGDRWMVRNEHSLRLFFVIPPIFIVNESLYSSRLSLLATVIL